MWGQHATVFLTQSHVLTIGLSLLPTGGSYLVSSQRNGPNCCTRGADEVYAAKAIDGELTDDPQN